MPLDILTFFAENLFTIKSQLNALNARNYLHQRFDCVFSVRCSVDDKQAEDMLYIPFPFALSARALHVFLMSPTWPLTLIDFLSAFAVASG